MPAKRNRVPRNRIRNVRHRLLKRTLRQTVARQCWWKQSAAGKFSAKSRKLSSNSFRADDPKTVGRPRDSSCLYEGHIYFEQNMGARQNIYFGMHFAWLKYFTHRLVQILAPNYKQHILSPAKVWKVCYSK
jgi:hypothetical protein